MTIPLVLGDELVYSGLAKGWAVHGAPILRGDTDVGDSLLYPLLLAPVYRLASDGATAFAATKVLNAIAMALAALPAYVFARRIVSPGWSLAVAALAVATPWSLYSGLTMTESLFYPAFILFAVVLAWTLEHPSLARQAVLLSTLAVLIGIRAQGLAVLAGASAAIAFVGLLEGDLRGLLRRFVPTFSAAGVVFGAGIAAAAAGLQVPTSSYDAVFGSAGRIGGILKWGAWNLGAYELAVGVVPLVVFPVALHRLLGRASGSAERTTGVVVVSLGSAVLLSVALLSASPYGLNELHERNLFYVTPLLLTCLSHWLSHGRPRPLTLASSSGAAAIALILLLPTRFELTTTNSVDDPSSSVFRALHENMPGVPLRLWLLAVAVAGVATFALSRTSLVPVVAVVLAFVAITANVDYAGSLTAAQDRALAWVDRALPGGANAMFVYVDYRTPEAVCAGIVDVDQQDLGIWTEYFNTHVDRVGHLHAAPDRDGLASADLSLGARGKVLEGGRTLAPAFVVVDSRQPVAGRRIARIDGSTILDSQNAASLSLWMVEPPLRFPSSPPSLADGLRC